MTTFEARGTRRPHARRVYKRDRKASRSSGAATSDRPGCGCLKWLLPLVAFFLAVPVLVIR